MNKTICFLSLAAVLLTACEKGLDDIEGSGVSGQVTNSLLQVRTRGAAAGSEATVTLADGEANTVTLGMERKVMLLQSMVLKKIPTAATAVSM